MTSVKEPRLRTMPIGTGETGTRNEHDSMGEIQVPAEHYWGARTQRSLIHFSIGDDHMPKAVYHADWSSPCRRATRSPPAAPRSEPA
ncbi:hypothetical protein [Nocardia transvalensis]|uniref:hypothetical protein n=1 Tax=Nocardia transvalensis TaxID=37333 RepID=UPI001E49E081|nr:hypothetical protein [Nocardia transvalensis]